EAAARDGGHAPGHPGQGVRELRSDPLPAVTTRRGPVAVVRDGDAPPAAPPTSRRRAEPAPGVAARLRPVRRPGPVDVVVAGVAARVVVVAALALVRFVAHNLPGHVPGHGGVPVRTTGLLGWDAGWYENIAEHGYHGAGPDSLRFFPLFPLVGRFL